MAYLSDIHKKNSHHKHDIIIREIFNTSHDVLDWVKKEEKKIEKRHSWVKNLRGIIHFICMTSIIFLILLLLSNWSAYTTFARAFIHPEALQAEKIQLESSIAETNIDQDVNDSSFKQERKQKILRKKLEKNQSVMPELGADYFNQDISQVSLSVNIAPYEDRIIIPKIGKNIPLVNVEHHDANSSTEWHKIFMKELEK